MFKQSPELETLLGELVNKQLNQTEQTQTENDSPSVEDNEFLNALLDDGKSLTELNKDNTPPEKAGADEVEKPTENVKPRSIAEVAEKLGLKIEDVYSLEVPLAGDGSNNKITISQLKDSVEQLRTFEAQKLAFEEDKVAFETGTTRAKDELTTIVNKLKDVIPPKHFESLIKAGRDEYSSKLNEQRAKVFEFIPEWKDKDVLTKEVEEINTFLEPYFGKKAFKQFNNAMMIKLLRDTTKREMRVKAAIEKMREVTPNVKSASRKAPVKKETPRSMVGNKVDPRKAFVDGLFNK